jgi:hypothetical protein
LLSIRYPAPSAATRSFVIRQGVGIVAEHTPSSRPIDAEGAIDALRTLPRVERRLFDDRSFAHLRPYQRLRSGGDTRRLARRANGRHASEPRGGDAGRAYRRRLRALRQSRQCLAADVRTPVHAGPAARAR